MTHSRRKLSLSFRSTLFFSKNNVSIMSTNANVYIFSLSCFSFHPGPRKIVKKETKRTDNTRSDRDIQFSMFRSAMSHTSTWKNYSYLRVCESGSGAKLVSWIQLQLQSPGARSHSNTTNTHTYKRLLMRSYAYITRHANGCIGVSVWKLWKRQVGVSLWCGNEFVGFLN